MKLDFNFNCSFSVRCAALIGALLFSSATSVWAEPPLEGGHDVLAERLAAVAAYVAADYPGAVRNGRVLVESEYEEQRGLLKEAQSLFIGLRPLAGHETAREALAEELGRLTSDIEGRADEKAIVTDARAIELRLINDFGLVLAPSVPPSEERARQLFAANCVACHGVDGRADTERARTLRPPPVSFFDRERLRRISPALAFHAISFGVSGTAMAAFDSLSAADRWSLAFYVTSLRHRNGDFARGEARLATMQTTIVPTASRLARLSDDELQKALPALPEQDQADILAFLRAVAPFRVAKGGVFADARRLLGELGAQAGTQTVDRGKARELAIAAYLDGVEPHEAALRARDPALAERVERALLGLRHAVDTAMSPEAIRKEVARTLLVLDSVEERAQTGASVPFFAASAIALREGFELSLLIAALLAFVRRSGHPEHARFVHAGWLAAVPAGILTWFAIGAALGGARRELTEGLLTLTAATMLLFVSHFVLGRLESQKWLRFLERRTLRIESREKGQLPSAWPLVLLAFIAAFREAIEIVVFFRALILDSTGYGLAVLLGAASGLLLLAGLVFAMSQLGKRMSPRPLMAASSVLLTILAISLVGQGIRSLQEGGYLSLTSLPLPSVPQLGLFASAEGLLVQGGVLCLAWIPALLHRRRAPQTA
jgi:high-affinity iron transporter